MAIAEHVISHRTSRFEIEVFESSLPDRIPQGFRDFLEAENGGKPEPSVCWYVARGKRQNVSVRFFFGLDPSGSLYSLQRRYSMYRDRIPENMLPIASDDFGNLVLLGLGSDSGGEVWFWDHELEDEDNVEAAATHIAPSFESFLSSLTPQ